MSLLDCEICDQPLYFWSDYCSPECEKEAERRKKQKQERVARQQKQNELDDIPF